MGDTYLNLRNQLAFRLGNRTDPAPPSGLSLTDLIKVWVNYSYIDLATKLRLPESEETATLVVAAADAGHPRYALPTDYFALIKVRDNTNNKALEMKTLRELREKVSTATTRLAHYALWRKELLFDPPLSTGNSATVQIDYRKRLTKLNADGDTSVLPDEWDEVIVQGAEYRALNDLGGPHKQEAAAAKALYDLMIRERLDRKQEESYTEEGASTSAELVDRE